MQQGHPAAFTSIRTPARLLVVHSWYFHFHFDPRVRYGPGSCMRPTLARPRGIALPQPGGRPTPSPKRVRAVLNSATSRKAGRLSKAEELYEEANRGTTAPGRDARETHLEVRRARLKRSPFSTSPTSGTSACHPPEWTRPRSRQVHTSTE